MIYNSFTYTCSIVFVAKLHVKMVICFRKALYKLHEMLCCCSVIVLKVAQPRSGLVTSWKIFTWKCETIWLIDIRNEMSPIDWHQLKCFITQISENVPFTKFVCTHKFIVAKGDIIWLSEAVHSTNVTSLFFSHDCLTPYWFFRKNSKNNSHGLRYSFRHPLDVTVSTT